MVERGQEGVARWIYTAHIAKALTSREHLLHTKKGFLELKLALGYVDSSSVKEVRLG